jgi:predicted DNA-binding protein
MKTGNKETAVTVRLDPWLYREFKKLGDLNHRSMAQMMRFLIEREIEVVEQTRDMKGK